jgi:hypothetical protein
MSDDTDLPKPPEPLPDTYVAKRALVKAYLEQNARESLVEAELYDTYAANQRTFAEYASLRATMADSMSEAEIDGLIIVWLARQQGNEKRREHNVEEGRLHALVQRWGAGR